MAHEDVGYIDLEKQKIYAELAYSTRGRSESFFYNLNSREELLKLIEGFENAPREGKRYIEKKLVRILLQNNGITGYKDECGARVLCLDIGDEKTVEKAVKKYKAYAKKLPKHSEIDKMFFKQLHDIYKTCRSSVGFLADLVNGRMKEISPELIGKGDSLRLLIFKQFLKSAEFPKMGCISATLRDFIYEKTNCLFFGGRCGFLYQA